MVTWGFSTLAKLTCLLAVFAMEAKTVVVVRVNGKAITAADVDFLATQQNVPDGERSTEDPNLIEQLIDRQLIRAFLTSRKIQPDAKELQHQIARAEESIRKNGEDPEKLLTKIGYTPERLKSELGLPIAWQVYARQTITTARLPMCFCSHTTRSMPCERK